MKKKHKPPDNEPEIHLILISVHSWKTRIQFVVFIHLASVACQQHVMPNGPVAHQSFSAVRRAWKRSLVMERDAEEGSREHAAGDCTLARQL